MNYSYLDFENYSCFTYFNSSLVKVVIFSMTCAFVILLKHIRALALYKELFESVIESLNPTPIKYLVQNSESLLVHKYDALEIKEKLNNISQMNKITPF